VAVVAEDTVVEHSRQPRQFKEAFAAQGHVPSGRARRRDNNMRAAVIHARRRLYKAPMMQLSTARASLVPSASPFSKSAPSWPMVLLMGQTENADIS
jgi:hypothetical protein